MDHPEIACVMPTYNSAHIVAMGVQSVLHQSFQDWELIVVDDSEDETREVVRAAADGDSRVHIVGLDRWTPLTIKREIGLQLSRAPFVSFWDCDDFQPACRLEVQLRAIKENGNDILLHIPYVHWCDPREPSLYRLHEVYPRDQVNCGSTYFFSRDWWNEILRGGYGWQYPIWRSKGADGRLRHRMIERGLSAIPSPPEYSDHFIGIDHGTNNWGYRLHKGGWDKTDMEWRSAMPAWAIAICEGLGVRA